MKTKEELNALKAELQQVAEKFAALSEEELAQITGGGDPNVGGPGEGLWVNQYLKDPKININLVYTYTGQNGMQLAVYKDFKDEVATILTPMEN